MKNEQTMKSITFDKLCKKYSLESPAVLKVIYKRIQKDQTQYSLLVKSLNNKALSPLDQLHADYLFKNVEEYLHLIDERRKTESLQTIVSWFSEDYETVLLQKLKGTYQEVSATNCFSIRFLLRYFGCNEKTFIDAIEFLPDLQERNFLRFSYGIHCRKMTKEEMLAFFNLDDTEYTNFRKQVLDHLQAIISKKTECFDPDDILMLSGKKRLTLANGKSAFVYYPSFVNYFVDEDASEEEKANVLEELKRILKLYDIAKPEQMSVVHTFYDVDLNLKKVSFTKVSEVSNRLKSCIKIFQKYLEKTDEQRIKDIFLLEVTFYDYFYEPSMNDQQKAERRMKVDQLLQYFKTYYPDRYDLIFQVYDENLALKLEKIEFSRPHFYKIIAYIKKLIKEEPDLKQLDFKNRRKDTFQDYFVTEDMDEQQKEKRLHLLYEAMQFYRENLCGFEALTYFYDENLQLRSSVVFDKYQSELLYDLRERLRLEIKELEQIQHMIPNMIFSQYCALRKMRTFKGRWKGPLLYSKVREIIFFLKRIQNNKDYTAINYFLLSFFKLSKDELYASYRDDITVFTSSLADVFIGLLALDMEYLNFLLEDNRVLEYLRRLSLDQKQDFYVTVYAYLPEEYRLKFQQAWEANLGDISKQYFKTI